MSSKDNTEPAEPILPQGEFKPEDKSKVKLEYFSEARVALMQEVKNHPQLCGYIVGIDQHKDWGLVVAEIAAYALVWMDGDYLPHELEVLYPKLQTRLQRKRGAC